MRGSFEFTFHTIAPDLAALAEGDPTLELLGAQGWEIRGLAPLRDGAVLVALQRRLDDESRLPDAPAISAVLSEPLTAPSAESSPGGDG